MADIFINYKREDRHPAEAIARALQSYGYSVWFDAALLAGVNFAREIERNIRDAKCLLTLWSRRSINSVWVAEEAQLGKALGILINVVLDDAKPPLGFRLSEFYDFSSWQAGWNDPAILSLLAAIASKVGRNPRPQQPEDVASWAIAQAANSEQALDQFIRRFP
jgi:hypothetical protein